MFPVLTSFLISAYKKSNLSDLVPALASLTIEAFENTSELQGDSNFARVEVF
jgi:hypothetical protein